jgi:deoxyadenosine/deoxycytidine kinase
MPSARKRFIAIAGNMGAGKSELSAFLAKRYGLKPFFEPNEANPYLADFYQDMSGYAFRSQIFFLTHKFRIHREIEREPGAVLQDRTIYEDAEIFARYLHRQGHIDKRDWRTYQELYQVVSAALAPPDLLIYLRCPVGMLMKRIAKRGRAMERGIAKEYLTGLNTLYERWLGRYHLSPVLTLQTDRLDYLTNLVDRLDLFQAVERHL